MTSRLGLILSLPATVLLFILASAPAPGCCPAPHFGLDVVNADQTVIILWDAATKTQHFIRQASFKSEGEDFGFLIPSPTQPELAESGDEAFPYLSKLTAPEVKKATRPMGFGCGATASLRAPGAYGAAPGLSAPVVTVLEEKRVAGFNAVVLEAKSAEGLLQWLKQHEYAYTPEVQAWAKPYVDAGWKITALKVAKDADGKADKTVSAKSLRMSFQTDRPLFPYREPDTSKSAAALKATHRLLRIYLLAEARYRGAFPDGTKWSGKVAWANKLTPLQGQKLLELLKLPSTTGPMPWWLTEFEDYWPYQTAAGDVFFSRDPDQSTVKRPPVVEYVASKWPMDATVYVIASALVLTPFLRRRMG